MKSTFVRMSEHEDFRKFMSEMRHSANYVVAQTGRQDAIDLCIAYGYERGLASGMINNLSDRIETLSEQTNANQNLHYALDEAMKYIQYIDRHVSMLEKDLEKLRGSK